MNCGGTLFETTKETLTVEGSFFRENWDRIYNMDSTEVFLDQDPCAFAPILSYLRCVLLHSGPPMLLFIPQAWLKDSSLNYLPARVQMSKSKASSFISHCLFPLGVVKPA